MDDVKISPEDSRPPFQQIAAQLREAIRTGALAPGEKLPSIADITKSTGVAYATARQAFAVLRNEGLVDTHAGVGVFVRRPRTRITFSNLEALDEKETALLSDEERAKNGGALEARTGISIDQVAFKAMYAHTTATQETPQFPDGLPLLQRTYEHRNKEDGTLLMWSRGWIPIDVIKSDPRLLDERNEPWNGGTHHQLRGVEVEIGRITNTVTARPATPEEAREWGMRSSDPMLIATGVWEDINGRVVSVGQSTYPSDRTSLEFVTDLPRWAAS